MLKKLLGCRSSSATLGENSKLVLSLEDALTPAMWVIDLNESPSLLLKVTQTEDNLYALQKLSDGAKGKHTEDLAFYNKKAAALNAMERASVAMKGQEKQHFIPRFIRTLFSVMAILIVLFAVSVYFRLDMAVIQWLSDDQVISTSTAHETQTNVAQPSKNTNDVGVPLSADDFFNNQSNRPSGLPF